MVVVSRMSIDAIDALLMMHLKLLVVACGGIEHRPEVAYRKVLWL